MKFSTVSTILSALVISVVASSAMAASTDSTRPAKPKLMKASIALPDYDIINAKRKPGTTATFQVLVKNIGNKAAPQGVLFGQHYLQNNQSWGADAIIPALAAGQTKKVMIKIVPENYTRGDKLVFTADYFKQLVESKENNNVYSMKYK